MAYKLYTDGGSRGNPGEAASGEILLDDSGKLIDFDAQYIGVMTNNQAEYIGLIQGLKLAIANGVKELEVYMDSELAIRQLTGVYKIKNEDIKVYKKEIDTLLPKFDTIAFNHVKRHLNKHADKILNLILDNRDK